MTPKDVLTNKTFCPMPWTGLMYNFDGTVKNCIRSAGTLGNIKSSPIESILHNMHNQDTQFRMTQGIPGENCYPCYDLEQNKRSFDIISDRVFYIRELKSVPLDTYRVNNHELHTIDVRWSNVCNFACTYCGPKFSSKWAEELRVVQDTPTDAQRAEFKEYIFKHAPNLKHVYLAGGEPLLMKENLELLDLLSPDVNLRINTNLSKVDTRVFNRICEFKNVHWIISVESIEEEYEYIRYGGKWNDFLDNLKTIQKLDHKISFNMLHFMLNYQSIFGCIEYLKGMGFHNNSFVIGPLLTPEYLNIRHLPNSMLNSVKQTIENCLKDKPGYLLEDGLRNMLAYIQKPFKQNIEQSLKEILELDQRRGISSQAVFKKFYNLIKENHYG
jgi:MoaA/NifB/PqqE/SkfB family radical SAM enzyme